jgi:hypothetical protein
MKKSARSPRSTKSTAKSRGVLGKWLRLVAAIVVLAGVGSWGYIVWNEAAQQISPEKVASTHSFLSQASDRPTLLLMTPGQESGTLASLTVIRFDPTERRIAVLELPINLSDNQTLAGQFFSNAYLKELQQLVESAIAVPLTGYVVMQPKGGQATVPNFDYLQTQASFWNLTIGLPFTLQRMPQVESNLSAAEIWRYLWMLHNINPEKLDVEVVPPAALLAQESGVSISPDAVDPVARQLFSLQEIRDEEVSVVVKNATATVGLAGLVGRFIGNMGGEVVAVEPADQTVSRSIMTAETPFRLTDHVSKSLGLDFKQEVGSGRERADVEIILGADILHRLGKQ